VGRVLCTLIVGVCEIPYEFITLVFLGEVKLLTEAEVQRSFNKLFTGREPTEDSFQKAEALLDELRPESPLRHRLSVELGELRKMLATKS
jgi:hypothetical protein